MTSLITGAGARSPIRIILLAVGREFLKNFDHFPHSLLMRQSHCRQYRFKLPWPPKQLLCLHLLLRTRKPPIKRS
jgi:hypothetical protein